MSIPFPKQCKEYFQNGKDYGVVANVCGVDRYARMGSKAWIVDGTGGEGWYRFVWVVRTRGGRIVSKWAPAERFNNFRCAWLPEWVRIFYGTGDLYMVGTKKAMAKRSQKLNDFADNLRRMYR